MNANKILPKMILLLGRLMPGLILLLLTRQAQANPTGMTVQSGTASLGVNGSQLTVTAGNNAFLNWQHFNIAAGESTIFNQPSASSIVWNRINDANPSQIYGNLQANGVVVLLNSSGFYFGPNSFVSAAGLVVSTANAVPPQNTGGAWEFNGPPPLASIVNYGHLKVGQGGSCYLIADQVENHGTIEAPGGSVGLASGQTVMLSERPDGRGMSMQVTLPKGSVNNYGTLMADAGTISLNAKVVNQNGFIQANSVKDVNGTIELVASDQLNLGANSKILAQGDASTGGSAGGNVALKSQNSFSDVTGSEISVAGGANGGDGGTVEISAPVMPAIRSAVDGSAHTGSTGGQLLIDPDYITLDTSGSDPVGAGGTVGVGSSQGGSLDLNVNSAFTGFNTITLQAKHDITLAPYTSWSLSDSTGQPTGTLVLEAGGNIVLGTGTALYDLNSWSISLYAGVTDFVQKTVQPGVGSILMGSNTGDNPSYIQTALGSINLVAGQDITLGYGRVTTTGGGAITAHALKGNIDTGNYEQGYIFNSARSATIANAYYVDPALLVGGISTTAGGDVTLVAGGNVTSFLPQGPATDANPVTAGSGAYGKGLGDFRVVAGGDVTGHYLVANGTGNIYAGVLMDSSGNPKTDAGGNYLLGTTGSAGNSLASPNLSLSLVAGGWNVTAADNINLQEVNNPNGDFNVLNRKSMVYHQFDYAATDFVNLTAGNLVQLGAPSSLLARLDPVPMILPGILNITAGAGGVVLNGDSTSTDNQLTLFPSVLGSLTVNTTHGGSLVAGSFTSEDPGSLDIGASSLFDLIVSDSGVNSKGVYQYDPSVGNFGLTDDAATPVHLLYDAATKKYDIVSEKPVVLKISGDMDYVYLASPEAAQISVGGDMKNSRFRGINLSPNDVTSIDVTGDILSDFYNDPATDAFGYAIGGGGQFDISARNLDLGTTTGIQSWGVGLYNIAGYYPLAQLFNIGANIRVNVTGNLTMYNTSIASLNGGNILVDASTGGNVEVGAAGNLVTSLGARGIYTTDGSDVTVIANGNVDANGSRIAAYDGGNVTVESLNGDVNAGTGGAGFVVLSSFKVNPVTHVVTADSPTIPGSGIVTTTFPDDPNAIVGNILVETPNGNVNASAGGIVQLPLNKAKANADSVVDVFAGYELQDGRGNPVTAADIASGTPVKVDNNPNGGNIDASGSGIIGENVTAKAAGVLQGVIFGQNNVNLTAPQLQNLTVLGKTVEATGNGGPGVTLIGTESVTTSGNSSGETVLSQNANGGGSSFSQGTAANSTSTAASASQDTTATASAKTDTTGEDDPLKKKKPVTLARKISRVTVLLPAKTN